jgi:hypothetical protein
MKLYNCYFISSSSIKEDKALSAYMTEFSSFNVIDVDMLEDSEKGEQKQEVGVGAIHVGLHNTVISSVL